MNTKVLIPSISTILVIIGAINWGLVGFFHFNIVESFFGSFPILVKLIYSLIALSGLYLLTTFKKSI
ncbi:MAG: DUF378 domain-containing protein [Candidatus Paracaedimonas acanthamoebae]|uniref:DUF378 domain-containing protein n=1 Tax=Candidatus Paracaedimonas acanthamoebae TaxID=244581 RepID=A0A8J7TUG3_9PROT|nr:DUF378 domain-containing protein [Candidatus Paracaedimonas acanthamoebae]